MAVGDLCKILQTSFSNYCCLKGKHRRKYFSHSDLTGELPELVADCVKDVLDLLLILLVRDHLVHLPDRVLAEGAVGPVLQINRSLLLNLLDQLVHVLEEYHVVPLTLAQVELSADLEKKEKEIKGKLIEVEFDNLYSFQ